MAIALDTNILIPLLVSSDPHHSGAKRWISGTEEKVVTTQTNIGEVLRLTTHPRVFRKPLSIRRAVELLQAFIHFYDIEVLVEPAEWWQLLPSIAENNPGLRGNEVFDARIALCLRHHGVKQICTFDSDFSKYKFLKIVHF